MECSMNVLERRAFIGSAAAAMLAAMGGEATAAQRSPAETANMRIVADFCAAWSTRDLQQVLPFLAEDSVYRMSETTPPVTGLAGVRERLGSWLETSQQIEFRILDTFAKGPMVVN